jgi:hypothetical protein
MELGPRFCTGAGQENSAGTHCRLELFDERLVPITR